MIAVPDALLIAPRSVENEVSSQHDHLPLVLLPPRKLHVPGLVGLADETRDRRIALRDSRVAAKVKLAAVRTFRATPRLCQEGRRGRRPANEGVRPTKPPASPSVLVSD